MTDKIMLDYATGDDCVNPEVQEGICLKCMKCRKMQISEMSGLIFSVIKHDALSRILAVIMYEKGYRKVGKDE